MDANLGNHRIQDRRSGPDPLIKLTSSIAGFSKLFVYIAIVFSWVLISTAFIIDYVIKTPFKGFIDSQNNYIERDYWFSALVDFSFYMLIFVFAVCILGLLVNSLRHHRKEDTYNKSLVIFTVLSFIGICVHLFVFII